MVRLIAVITAWGLCLKMAWTAFWIIDTVLVLYLLAYCFEICLHALKDSAPDLDPDKEDIFLMKTAGLIVLGIIGLAALFFLFVPPLILSDTATVQLKKTAEATAIPDRKITGAVIKQDTGKAIIIESEQYGTQAIPWDQIDSVTIENRPPLLQLSNSLNERFTALSYLTIFIGVLAFFVAYRQYREAQNQNRETQRWKREEFLATTVKDFNTHPEIRNAKLMLDSFKTQSNGRKINLFPDETLADDKYIFVTHQDIFDALNPSRLASTDKAIERKYVTISDCFDSFLSGLSRFDYYIDRKLVTKGEVELHLIYWLSLMGDPTTPLRVTTPDIRRRIFLYTQTYNFGALESLMKIYEIKGHEQYIPAPPTPPGSS